MALFRKAPQIPFRRHTKEELDIFRKYSRSLWRRSSEEAFWQTTIPAAEQITALLTTGGYRFKEDQGRILGGRQFILDANVHPTQAYFLKLYNVGSVTTWDYGFEGEPVAVYFDPENELQWGRATALREFFDKHKILYELQPNASWLRSLNTDTLRTIEEQRARAETVILEAREVKLRAAREISYLQEVQDEMGKKTDRFGRLAKLLGVQLDN
jgi:hypothetical protein